MQTRKIFDIAPPASRSSDKRNQENRPEIKTKHPAKKGGAFSLVVLLLIIIGLVYWFTESSAIVYIKPVIHTFASSTNVIASAKQAGNPIISLPLEELVTSKDYSEKFQASQADVKSKAGGVITLYNENSTVAEVFAQGTRFMDDKGNVFLSLKKASVSGKKGNTPGSVDVQVQAIDYGSDYNIGPSYFSIPKLKSTPYYTKYYGKSSQPMKGGMVGRARVVSQEDLDKAKQELTQKYQQEALDILKNQYKDYFILEKSINYNIVYSDPSVQVGELADEFFYNIKVEIKSFGIQQQNMDNLVSNFITINLPENAKIVPKSLNFKVDSRHTDLSKKEVEFDLGISCRYYKNFSLDFLREKLVGVKTSQVSEIIKSDPSIETDSFWVDFKPFYKPRLPKDVSKIEASVKGVD